MTDLYDLEQNIQECWQIVDDIQMLHTSIEEGKPSLSSEQDILDFLFGIKTIYNLRFEKLFKTLEEIISVNSNRQFSDEKLSQVVGNVIDQMRTGNL